MAVETNSDKEMGTVERVDRIILIQFRKEQLKNECE
jgi:hypothetical protein